MSKKPTLLILFFLISFPILAQQESQPNGGGEYKIEKSNCVSPSERQRIQTMLESNIQMLKAQNVLPQDWGEPKPGAKPAAGSFIWPLKQSAGFNYNSYYGISNFVDLDPINPNYLLDWNCGERTYDLPGYNHGGIDIFLWPFSQNMQQDGQVEIIAAADGIIIGKDNGNFDKNCSMGSGNWNAVYVGNNDGTICWYGHMKNNSLTSKAIGLTVTAGEYLGLVGSSGQSTGPHLHFETHSSTSEVLEPYEGPCNANASLWANQKPYIEPTINALLTHHAPPEFPPCPQLEVKNTRDTFLLGATTIFAAYYHDQTNANATVYTILKPDNTVFNTWNHTSNSSYYTASYWFWTQVLSSNPADMGAWTYRATYEGNTVEHKFYLSDGTININEHKVFDDWVQIYPNPNNGKFVLTVNNNDKGAVYTLSDIAGRTIQNGMVKGKETELDFSNSILSGMYFLKVSAANGSNYHTKIVVR